MTLNTTFLHRTPALRTTCGKNYYPTEDAAERHLQRLQSKPFKRYAPRRVYACPRCHGWHLTAQVGVQEQAAMHVATLLPPVNFMA